MIIIATILLLAALTFKIVHDYKFWLKGRGVNHKLEWWWMVAMCSPSIALFTLASKFFWYLALPISAGMCSSFIWLFFDGIYNILRREGFFYTGTNDPEDAASDNFLQAIPTWTQVFIKTLPLGILIYLYIVSL